MATTISLKGLTQEQKKQVIENFIASDYKKATYITITFKKSFDILKGYLKANGVNVIPQVEKETTATFRLDCNYQNTADYENHQHNKVYVNNQVLNNLFEYNTETKKYKLRIFLKSLKQKVESTYKLNGNPIEKSELAKLNMITTSEFKPHTFDSIMFTPLLENVLELKY